MRKVMTPSTFKARTPGWVLMRVSVGRGDRDQIIASWRDEPWVKRVRYLGAARGFHVFERPPA